MYVHIYVHDTGLPTKAAFSFAASNEIAGGGVLDEQR
jgi:hypothetical protein